MNDQPALTKVLITVLTYPHPSRGYQELVCTAGITETFDWIRLYPVDYRYRPMKQKFKKYQWIEVELMSQERGNDNRKESRRPKLDSIHVIGDPLTTKQNWSERREIIDRLPHSTLNELKSQHNSDRTSLGIVRPKRVIDLEIRTANEPEWKPEWRLLFQQRTLFGPAQKPLRSFLIRFIMSLSVRIASSRTPQCARIGNLGRCFSKSPIVLALMKKQRRASEISSSMNCVTMIRIRGSSWELISHTTRGLSWAFSGLQKLLRR